jgi:hypothetical protein
MQCARCETETEAGASFTFYYGPRAKANLARPGNTGSTPAADRVVGSEQVFFCSACQVTGRHRAFRKAALICGAVIVCSPAIVGLVLYSSLVPAWSALTAFLLSVPVVGIVIGVGGIIVFGLLARSAIAAFGEVVWIACTWRKPYALSGDDPNFDKTAEGEVFAMSIRQAELKRQGYDACFTRKASSRLGRSGRMGTITTIVLFPVRLFVLGIFTLACIGLGEVLVDWIH